MTEQEKEAKISALKKIIEDCEKAEAKEKAEEFLRNFMAEVEQALIDSRKK